MKASTSFPSSSQKLDSKPARIDRWRNRMKMAKAWGKTQTRSHNAGQMVNWNIVPIDWRMKAIKAIIQLARWLVIEAIAPTQAFQAVSCLLSSR